MIYDAYRLVVTFYPALVEDPCQLYISALPQCPATSLLRACNPEAVAIPRSLLPYPAWSPSVTHEIGQLPPRTGVHETITWTVRPSPDGRWVAASRHSRSGRLGDIHLRDATTGIILRTLHVHASGLVDFGFSSNSRFIASATCGGEIFITDCGSGVHVASYKHTDGDVTRVAFRCRDSELILVHTRREYGLDRPVHFLILDWDRTERTEGQLRPKRSSDSLRKDTTGGSPWSISPDGLWGILWATGDLLDLHSFDEVHLPCTPDATVPRSWGSWDDSHANNCGTWLSVSSLVCSIPREDGCSLIIVDIGQNIKELEHQPRRLLSTSYRFGKMEACANGHLVALSGFLYRDGIPRHGDCIYLWDPNGDEIHFVKSSPSGDFSLSPLGDTLHWAIDSTWSVIPTSQSSIAADHPFISAALKFSATRDTIMVMRTRWVEGRGWELDIVSRGFLSSSGTAGVVRRHDVESLPLYGDVSLTPDPQWTIFPAKEVVLSSTDGSRRTFSDTSRHSQQSRSSLVLWLSASMSPNLSHIVACGTGLRDHLELTFALWDTASANLLHTFRTPRPSLPNVFLRREIVVTDTLDLYYVLEHHSFPYRYSDFRTSNPDDPRLLPLPEPEPVPGEWFQIGDDGWVTRSDGHPEVDVRGRDRLFWVPASQRIDQLWRGDQHLLAMTTEYDVIVLDLSDFDDDTKAQPVPRLQIETE